MFAVVFFYGDKSIDVVNKKKVKTVLENTSPEVGLDVNIKYQVHDIDESGRDIKKEEDFKGFLVHWGKDKKEALSFVEQHSEQIVTAFNQGKDNLIAWSKSIESNKKPESGPRKRKITTKMREMLEEHTLEAGVPATETKIPSAADGVSETKKIQAREYFKKKKAKQNHDSAVKLDAPQMSSTSSSCSGTDETTIIAEQSHEHNEATLSHPINIPSTAADSIQVTTPGSVVSKATTNQKNESEGTGLAATLSNQAPSTSTTNLNPEQNISTRDHETPFTPPKKKTILPANFSPIRRSPRLMEKHASRLETLNQRSGIQTLLPIHSTPEKARHNLHFGIVNNPPSTFQNQLISPYESCTEMNTAEILGQSLYTLNNAVCSSEECRKRISHMEKETEDLKTQLETMRSRQDQSLPVLIQEMRDVLDRWQQPNYNREIFQPSRMDYDFSPPRPSNLDGPQNLTTTSFINEDEGAENSTSDTVMQSNESLEESINFDQFFQPGEGKIKLVEGQSLYIDSVKLAILKRKCKKNESKTLKALLDFYFTPKYLAMHSATGEKSTKPGLPVTILSPIRDYMQQHFKVDSSAVNAIINRKCLDAKRSKKC